MIGAVVGVVCAALTTLAESSAVVVTGAGAWTILKGLNAGLVAKLGGSAALAKLLSLGGLGVTSAAVAGAAILGILGERERERESYNIN